MIDIHDLTVSYGGKPVLSDVNLSFRPGQLTVLAGPNGSGKSTLLKSILGIVPCEKGQILLDGTSLKQLGRRTAAKRIAYMTQFRPIPEISGRQLVLNGRFPYLDYSGSYKAEDREAVERALLRADALELGDRRVSELSGGERQKLYLAMALAQETDTILMDEPVNFLDVSHQMEVLKLAASLAAEGRTVVVVLHDLCLALRFGTEIAVLDHGRLAARGTPAELLASGVIPQVFGVNVGAIRNGETTSYYYC